MLEAPWRIEFTEMRCQINGWFCVIYERKVLNGITSRYLREGDLLMEPDDIEKVRKILETLSVHMLMRSFNAKIKFVQCSFFNLAAAIEPFFTRFYRMDGDPEVCVHNLLLLSFDIDQTCAFCKSHYEDKNWTASVRHLWAAAPWTLFPWIISC